MCWVNDKSIRIAKPECRAHKESPYLVYVYRRNPGTGNLQHILRRCLSDYRSAVDTAWELRMNYENLTPTQRYDKVDGN
jgi:hypothetical protein